MTATGVWGERNPKEGTAARGEDVTRKTVDAAAKFIDRWNEYAGFEK
jgi:creatinine amidohydrolase